MPDFTNRYFIDDIPEDLCMYKCIADLADFIHQSSIKVFLIFRDSCAKESLKDGKLAGKDVGETKSPQRYGKNTLEELLAD